MADLSKFFPNGFSAATYSKPLKYSTGEPSRAAFLKELNHAGFKVSSIDNIGVLERCDAPTDKPNKRSGWYIYYEISDESGNGNVIGIGIYGSWKGNPERVVWTSKHAHYMSPEEKRIFNERINMAKDKRESELKERQGLAASQAMFIWESGGDNATDHPYTKHKGIVPYGAKTTRKTPHHAENVTIPVYYEGDIVSLQFISADGKKVFLPDGKIKGGYFQLHGDTTVIYVCEGYATGCTIREATGCMVYVAFNAGNILDVANSVRAMHQGANIVIAGDDDRWTDGNPGRTKAMVAADALQCQVAFPEFGDVGEDRPTDFNDMAKLYGLENVKRVLESKPQIYKEEKNDSFEFYTQPIGIVADIVAYYNATSGNKQPGFAIQTALAICSIICSRHYRTTKDNYSSLYFLNVAKSSTGKEHSKTVIERVLEAAGVDHLISGDGYTSAGAVFSTLLQKPRHITVIDEFGRYLEASRNAKNTNQLEANTKIMEAITRCHSIMRPPSYSTMTLPKDKIEEMQNRKVYNPAITILAITTPVTFFGNIDNKSIADGFMNRFIISISEAERAVREHKDIIDVPVRIIDWIKAITERSKEKSNIQETAAEQPIVTELSFSDEAYKMQRDFQEYCIDMQNRLENVGMSELPGRSTEIAMRMSMIIALAENPMATVITAAHMAWSIEYVKCNLELTMKKLKMTVSGSQFESFKKEALLAIRNAGAEGISRRDMNKAQPFSKWSIRDRNEIIAALIEAELVIKEMKSTSGRPREVYMALA